MNSLNGKGAYSRNRRLTKKEEASVRLSKEHNALRFITIDGYTFEKVGIELTNVGWVTTLKMPYCNLETKSRYKQVSEKKLKELLNG